MKVVEALMTAAEERGAGPIVGVPSDFARFRGTLGVANRGDADARYSLRDTRALRLDQDAQRRSAS